MNITEAMGWAEHTEKTTPEFMAMKALRKEVLRLREEATPPDYVEQLERSNASLQQQADRGVNCAMKLRIATEHLQKWRKRAENAESNIRAANTLWEGIERIMYLFQDALEEIAEFEREIGQPSTEALIAIKALEVKP